MALRAAEVLFPTSCHDCNGFGTTCKTSEQQQAENNHQGAAAPSLIIQQCYCVDTRLHMLAMATNLLSWVAVQDQPVSGRLHVFDAFEPIFSKHSIYDDVSVLPEG